MVIQVIVRYISNKGKVTKQLPIDADQDVAELQQLIKSNFGIPAHQQIIHFVTRGYEVRVIPGFPLDFYEIGYNALLDLRRLEEEEGNQVEELAEYETQNATEYNNELYQRRVDYFNKLRFAQLDLQTIEEADEEEGTDEEKLVADLKRQFFEITRNKRKKEIGTFLERFKQLNQGTQFSILDNFDKAGWSGVHYAVLFDLEELVKSLLEISGGDFLGIVSSDGWSPLFLSIQQKNWKIFREMLTYADKNQLEVQTLKGSLLHQVFKYGEFDIIEELVLNRKVDPYMKDFEGQAAIELCSDGLKEKIKFLVEIRELPPKPIGVIGRVKKNTFFFGWSARFLRLNVENRVLERYKHFDNIPFKPLEIIPIRHIENIKVDSDEAYNQLRSYFLQFKYAGTQHVYRIEIKDEATIWQNSIKRAIDWADYHHKYLAKYASNPYKQKTKLLWEQNNKNFEEFNLLNKIEFEKAINLLIPVIKVEKKIKANISFRDFDVIKLLGRGAFGKVYKVVHKKTNKTFAMKMIRKENLIKHQQEKYSKIERDILKENRNKPFLLSLHFAFQTPQYLYMVVDYCPNGDLALLLAHQPNSRFPEGAAKFYMAEILLAIDDLHQRNHIYRDLKPDNILIDEEGHVKLADFGLAADNIRTNNDFAKSFAGSPIYLSPEILKNKRTFKISDYYTFGVVLYELVVGDPPFYTDDINKLYSNIKKGHISFPNHISVSDSFKSVVSELMQNNPKLRLGANKGMAEVKEHSFFKDIDWKKLANKEIKPPVEMEKKDEKNNRRINIKDIEYTPETQHVHFFNNFDYIREEYLELYKESVANKVSTDN